MLLEEESLAELEQKKNRHIRFLYLMQLRREEFWN